MQQWKEKVPLQYDVTRKHRPTNPIWIVKMADKSEPTNKEQFKHMHIATIISMAHTSQTLDIFSEKITL